MMNDIKDTLHVVSNLRNVIKFTASKGKIKQNFQKAILLQVCQI